MMRFDGIAAIKAALFYALGVLAVAVGWAVLAFALIILGANYRPSYGQHAGHSQHHELYKSWFNRAGAGCCDNQHCRPIDDRDERTSRGFLEVRVEGQWCPVEARHFLLRGNVPNASVSHVCAWGAKDIGWEGKSPCERLLCYQPKPMM